MDGAWPLKLNYLGVLSVYILAIEPHQKDVEPVYRPKMYSDGRAGLA